MGTLKPIDYPTFLSDFILVLWAIWAFLMVLSPYNVPWLSHLSTYILKAFPKLLGIGNHHVDVMVFVVVVAVGMVFVLGLIMLSL